MQPAIELFFSRLPFKPKGAQEARRVASTMFTVKLNVRVSVIVIVRPKLNIPLSRLRSTNFNIISVIVVVTSIKSSNLDVRDLLINSKIITMIASSSILSHEFPVKVFLNITTVIAAA